jgi:hypothetical protein
MTDIYVLEVSDHGRSADSSWSSLELAQDEAARVSAESDGGLHSSGLTLAWEQENDTEEGRNHWRTATHEGVSGTFGFSITRTVLDQPHQF